MELGSAADWFSGGMTAIAVIVALAGYGISEWQRKRDRKEAELQSGRLIGIKLMKVLNGTNDIHRHLWANYEGPPLGGEGANELWRTIHPLVGLQDDPTVTLDGAEINLLIRANETNFLQELMLATVRYQSIVSSMKEYQLRYEAIYELSPAPIAMNGLIGTHMLTAEQYLKIKPYSLALENLVQNLKAMAAENLDLCKRLASEYAPIMKQYFRIEKFLTLAEPSKPTASSVVESEPKIEVIG